MSFDGETAYITGGASGIARAIAAGLVSKGMRLVIADRNIQGAKEAAQELNKNGQFAWPVQVDVADWESQEEGFETAVKVLGHIDYVLASAGITEAPFTPNRPEEQGFQKPNLAVWDINGTGALYTTSLAIQQFRRQKPNKYGFRGKIALVASGCGFYYVPALPVYTASKHALVGLVRTWGQTLPEERITLNAICPNIVKTNISTGDFYAKADEKGLLITVDSLKETFEALLGENPLSGEAVEVLPGNDGWRVKERIGYTNEKAKESVELTIARSSKPKAN